MNNFNPNMMAMMNMLMNPQSAMEQMLKSNPNYAKAMDLVKQYGDPKKAFYALAKEKGIDPEQFLNQFK